MSIFITPSKSYPTPVHPEIVILLKKQPNAAGDIAIVKYRFFNYEKAVALGRKKTFKGELIKHRSFPHTHSEFQFSERYNHLSFSSTIEDSFKGCRFKLIEYFVRGRPTAQLFDLESDPAETANLADDPEYADTRARLRDRLAEWQDLTDDPRRGDWPT